jgi:hypothetical protein
VVVTATTNEGGLAGPGTGVRAGERVAVDGEDVGAEPGRFPDRPAGSRFDPPGDGEGGEDDRQVGLDGVALAVVDGPDWWSAGSLS